MTTNHTTRLACVCAVLALSSAGPLRAQMEIGTWVRKAAPGQPGMTMEVSTCCGPAGRRLVYHIVMGNREQTLTVESPFDGTEVPVLVDGKPIGETMAIKRLDPHHASTVVKMNGKPFGTSQATLSPNGSTLTVENDFGAPMGAQTAGKSTEVWLKK